MLPTAAAAIACCTCKCHWVWQWSAQKTDSLYDKYILCSVSSLSLSLSLSLRSSSASSQRKYKQNVWCFLLLLISHFKIWPPSNTCYCIQGATAGDCKCWLSTACARCLRPFSFGLILVLLKTAPTPNQNKTTNQQTNAFKKNRPFLLGLKAQLCLLHWPRTIFLASDCNWYLSPTSYA